ncbi:MAG TPA: proton-conducting transporter membrane subunit [Candidatus Binatia bacterium]|jgi:multicomponent Na+:H+ antiporter subunit D|nr:proton-conducting transporter membrane subunit [Candidatus Binatia bacterium]
MADLLVAPVLWPLVTAIVLLSLGGRPGVQRLVSLVSQACLLAVAVALAVAVKDGTVLVHRLGGWPAPFGIVLVADRLTAVMLLLTAVTGLAVLLYEAAAPDRELERLPFFPLFHFLLMGLDGAFVTGDLFNLFVFFEVLLIASYALATLGASARQLRAGLQFVVLNLLSSALFLFGVGTLYGLTGTLNLADLAGKVEALGSADAGLLRVAMMSLLVVFAAKAALIPLAFWLPDTYPAPSPVVSAMFGGIATKVGVYALLRVFTTVFDSVRGPGAEVLLVLGIVSMLVGVLGAVAQTELRRLLSFHIVSQIGYLVFGIGLFTIAGVGAAIFYMVHYTIVKCALFLLSGSAERLGGARDLKQLGGLAHQSPALAALFFVGAISLAGLPPTSGFMSKAFLASAAIADGQWVGVVVIFAAGLLTLFSMTKIWTMAFWGEPPHAAPQHAPVGMLWAAALLVSFSMTLALAADPLFRFTQATATQLLDRTGYVAAVLAPGARP